MTTVAWDGKTLAADRLCSGPGLSLSVRKIRRMADGSLIGAAGNASACAALLDWIEGGRQGKPPVPMSSPDWSDIMLVSPEGRVSFFGAHGQFPVEDTFAAIGSGFPFAVAAMALGRTARQAVELATRFDIQTGGGVDVLPLKASR